ncbi:FG-GAP-like repeat-containing protein [Pyxidicoccus fallax]|nr:FG-GAP-like repeat-containing protein [Pyxidicoccus fallax]
MRSHLGMLWSWGLGVTLALSLGACAVESLEEKVGPPENAVSQEDDAALTRERPEASLTWDPYADAVASGTTATVLNSSAALGAPDGQAATLLGLLNTALVLDLGQGEEGTGDLRVYYQGLSLALVAQVDFLKADGTFIGSSSLHLMELGLGTHIAVATYPGNVPYRYVRLRGSVLALYLVDAVETSLRPICGDGVLGGFEVCDDGNQLSGDGCNSVCTVEPGYACTGQPSICTDIDECANGTANCQPNEICVNTPGSYTCEPDLCAGVVCAPLDECHVAGTCDSATGLCSNPTAPDGTLCGGGICEAGVCRAPVLDFQPHQDSPAGTRPYGVAVGDINNDGRLDVAFTLITSALVSVQLGNGDGTFGAASTFPVGSNPKFVEIADFNGDGNADLAVGGYINSMHSVSILLGNGDGTFQGRVDYNVNSADPSGVKVADYNGDGKLDIATANFVGSTVSILLGNGDGTFQAAVPHAMPGTPNSVATVDLNGDGKLDIVTGNYNGRSVGVLLGNGDGTFQSAVTTPLGRFVQVVAVGDLNGDGRADVAASLFNDKLVSVLLGNGDGTFQSAVDYPVANGAGDLHIADFNGDGRADLAGTLFSSNAVGVLLGNGDGTLQPAINFAVGTGPFFMAVGDLNGDGKRDIVTGNYSGGTSSVLLNASH